MSHHFAELMKSAQWLEFEGLVVGVGLGRMVYQHHQHHRARAGGIESSCTCNSLRVVVDVGRDAGVLECTPFGHWVILELVILVEEEEEQLLRAVENKQKGRGWKSMSPPMTVHAPLS